MSSMFDSSFSGTVFIGKLIAKGFTKPVSDPVYTLHRVRWVWDCFRSVFGGGGDEGGQSHLECKETLNTCTKGPSRASRFYHHHHHLQLNSPEYSHLTLCSVQIESNIAHNIIQLLLSQMKTPFLSRLYLLHKSIWNDLISVCNE